MKARNGYHKILSACLDEVAKRLDADRVELVDREWRSNFESIPYGESLNWYFAIETLKGKPTRKFFHVNIYRLDSGRYELNTYIL